MPYGSRCFSNNPEFPKSHWQYYFLLGFLPLRHFSGFSIYGEFILSLCLGSLHTMFILAIVLIQSCPLGIQSCSVPRARTVKGQTGQPICRHLLENSNKRTKADKSGQDRTRWDRSGQKRTACRGAVSHLPQAQRRTRRAAKAGFAKLKSTIEMANNINKTDLSGMLGERISLQKVSNRVVVTNRPKQWIS